MANVGTTVAQLLLSEKYSDLTLVCNGQEFRVHKAIVCPQSPVIDSALKGRFEEARTNKIEVEFDIEILKCMLDYMYKANYKEEPVGPVQRVQSTQEGWPASSTIANTMLYHVRVNGIADYYDVTGLATLSVTRLSVLLQQYWSERGFCELVQEAGTLTGDKNLRQLLIKTAASHAPELLHGGWFSEGRIANEMAAEVLKALSGHVEHLRSRIVRAETKNNSLENLLRELIDVWHVRNILDA